MMIMHSVIPKAMMPVLETDLKIFKRFFGVKKVGWATEMMTHSTRRPNKIPQFSLIKPALFAAIDSFAFHVNILPARA